MLKRVTHQIRISGKVYAPGLRDFNEEIMKHDHFKHYVKAGRIVDAEEAKEKVVSEEDVARRKEMEARYGVPKAVAPLKVEDDKAEEGYEPKVEVEEAPAQASKHKSKR